MAVTSKQLEKCMKEYKQELPHYQKLYNYYIGKHDILNRVLPDKDKPNNKIVADYAGYIVDTVVGYFASIPIAYLNTENNKEYLEDLNKVFFFNDEEDVNAEIVKDCAIFGKAYEVMWIDREGQVRFTQYNPLEMHVEKDNKDNIKCAFRPFEEEDKNGQKEKYLEVYEVDGIRYFKQNGSQYIELKDQFKPHHFGEIPVIIYKNNDEELGDFEKQIPMINGINKILSDSQNELESFANAYLKIKGAQGTTAEDVTRMRQDGVLLLDEDGEAEWLIKNVNNQFQQNFFDTVDDLIHNHTATPKLTSEDFPSNLSGVAIKFKLHGLEAKCSVKERKMNKALRKRIRLITKILNLKGNDYKPYTIRFQFSRNVPSNENEITDQIVKLQNMVDKETLLSWHPKIENAAQVIEKYKDEQPQVDLEKMFDNEKIRNLIDVINNEQTG